MTFRSTLLVLLLSLALVECRPHRETNERRDTSGNIKVAFYREHPEIVVHACGQQLLMLAMDVLDNRCPKLSDRKRKDMPHDNISSLCCTSAGCSYDDIDDYMC